MTDERREFELGSKASMAVEGSLAGVEGLRAIHDYVDTILKARGDQLRSSGLSGAALAFFLAYVRQAADPEGDSIFRLRIERRNPHSKRTPAQVREWEEKHVLAALLVEHMVRVEGRKKEAAIEHICGLEGLNRSEIFKAEKSDLYKRMLAHRLQSPSKSSGV